MGETLHSLDPNFEDGVPWGDPEDDDMDEIALDDHDPAGCHLCPACADKLKYIEAALDRLVVGALDGGMTVEGQQLYGYLQGLGHKIERLMPLADLLDQLRVAPGDGQVPSLFKVLGALRGDG